MIGGGAAGPRRSAGEACRRPFATRDTTADAALPAEMDALHGTLSGPATKKLCGRAYARDGDERFVRLARISVSRLYNLRRGKVYRRQRGPVSKTCPVQPKLGERRVDRAWPASLSFPVLTLQVCTVRKVRWRGG